MKVPVKDELAAMGIGIRVLCVAEHVERSGVVVAEWPNGSRYVRLDDGEVVACGIEALLPEAHTR